MPLTAGIVGLPNVGKSTLFNAITQAHVEAANYPFATISPNIGIVNVPDLRMEHLTKMFQPKKVVYPTFEFTDIAGLVKGASQGEGLGNQFLAHIREVDVICHIVRCFDDENIVHVENSINPTRDIEIINLELIFADLTTIEKRLDKITKKVKADEKGALFEYNLLKKAHQHLLNNKGLRFLDLTDREKSLLNSFQLLTNKPVLYIANMSDNEITTYQDNLYYQEVDAIAKAENSSILAISAQIEAEIIHLPINERAEFLSDLNITQSGLDQIILSCYKLLNLGTFFTVGAPEVHGWTFKIGTKAPECAGVIHSDFQKGFIRVEAYSYNDLMLYKSEQAIKDAGQFRVEGKEYLVQDGDILHFRFNV